MLNDICGLLLRFRLKTVAIVADIEKAFLQIGLQESQRDVTRFIWLKDYRQPILSKENIQAILSCAIRKNFKSVPSLSNKRKPLRTL